MNKKQTYIFFGIVGSGKGTQVKLLENYLKEKEISNDILSVSTGDEYRKIIQSGSYMGELIKKVNEKGELQPNFLTISIYTNIVINSLKEETTFISDGFPRTVAQSESFEDIMNFYHRDKINIIEIVLSKEEATKRMKLRNRADDNDEGIAKRFEEYTNNVVPSMNYFENKESYKIHKINGEQSIEEVHSEIIKSLNI
jgi:adenylate kinase family enzyme